MIKYKFMVIAEQYSKLVYPLTELQLERKTKIMINMDEDTVIRLMLMGKELLDMELDDIPIKKRRKQ